MITPLFIPVNIPANTPIYSGSDTPMSLFSLYFVISGLVLFAFFLEITDFYWNSITITILGLLVCIFLGWLLVPIIILIFIILYILLLIKKRKRNKKSEE